MKVTDYLAIWGASVATIVAIWNIYKDFLKRHHLKVSAAFQLLIVGDGSPHEEVFAVTISNLSDRPAKITHVGGYYDRHYKPGWLDRLIGRVVKRSTTAFLFSFNTYKGPSLPLRLEPWDKVVLTYNIPASKFPAIETLEVITADDRRWFAPRRDIERIHADETYQKAHKKPSANAKAA